jgi:CRP/FNR family transcriptional regulator, cyclic AMP receptor protein
MELGAALAAIPAFSALGPDDFEALRYAFLERAVSNGTVLIEEGKRGAALVLVLEGKVATTRVRGAAVVALGEAGPGALLGVVSLVDDAPRSATCSAVGPSRVATLTPSAAMLLMSSHESLSLALHTAVGTQLAADVRRLERRLAGEPG